MDITTIGLDLAKNVFQVHGINAVGDVIVLVTFLRNALPGSGCSSWDNALSKTGGSYADLITWPKSSPASHSKTELKPPNPTRSPHDRQTSNIWCECGGRSPKADEVLYIGLTVSVKRRTTMKYYVGLDVSLKEISVCV